MKTLPSPNEDKSYTNTFFSWRTVVSIYHSGRTGGPLEWVRAPFGDQGRTKGMEKITLLSFIEDALVFRGVLKSRP